MKKDKILLFQYDREKISQGDVERIAKMLEPGFKKHLPEVIVIFLPDGIEIRDITFLE